MDEGRLAISGLVVLLSWIGWGVLVRRVLCRGRGRWSWGILAAIGMAVMLALGGVLAMESMVGVATLGGATTLGVMISALGFWRQRGARVAGMKSAGVWAIGLILLGALAYIISVRATALNPGDDLEAYMVFPKQLIESGTLLAPFSIRRLGTYGGQALLQAQWMAAVRWMWGERVAQLCLTHGHVVDAGICTVVAAGILWGAMRARTERRRMLVSLAIAAFFVAMVQRVNTHAEASGVVLFLALWQVLPLMGRRRNFAAAGVLVGLVAAGAASLRMNYAGAVVVTVVAAGIFAVRGEWRRWSAVGIATMVILALLTPWAVVLVRSSGSPFYPLLRGNDRGLFLSTGITTTARAVWAGMSLLYPPIWSLLFVWVPVLFMRRRRDLLPLLLGATVMTLLLGWSFTNQETINLYRLASPVLMASAWASILVMMKRWERSGAPFRWGTLGLLALLAAGGAYPYSDSFRHSFPLAALPMFFLAIWALATKSRGLRGLAGIAAAVVVLWTAFRNRGRMAEGGVFFFDVASVVIFAAIAWRAITFAERIGAAIVVLGVGGIFLLGWIGIAGIGLVTVAFLWMATSTWVIWWTGREAGRMDAWAALAVLAGIAVLSMVNRGFLLESLAPWICVASVGGAAWVALRETGALRKSPAIGAMVVAAFAGMPNIVAVYHFGTGLMAMGLCVLAAVVLMRMCLHPLLPAIVLLLGAILLGKEEVPSLITDGAGRGYDDGLQQIYADAQDSTPVQSAIFTWATTPALFDFGRNTILVPDYDGLYASPPPGLPVRSDAESLRGYLLKEHIEYAALDLNRLKFRPSGVTVGQNLEQLSRTGRVLFRSPDLVVFDLRH